MLFRLLPLIFVCPLDISLARGHVILSFGFAFCLRILSDWFPASRPRRGSRCRTYVNMYEMIYWQVEIAWKLIFDEKEREKKEARMKKEDFSLLLHRKHRRGCAIATMYLRIPARVYLRSPRQLAYLFDAWRNHDVRTCACDTHDPHTYTHTHVRAFKQVHTYTYTRYRYQLLLLYYYSTTAIITTIIGCLSIRLTPSSGPNYYVTIFIDNKGRNKY